MLAQDKAALARRLWDSIKSHDWTREQRSSPTIACGKRSHGRDLRTARRVAGRASLWIGAFPGGKVQLTDLVATEDSVAGEEVVEVRGRARCSRPRARLRIGPSVEMRLCEVLELEGGRVESSR